MITGLGFWGLFVVVICTVNVFAVCKKCCITDPKERNDSVKIRELAKYCESIDIDCDICECKKECEDFKNRMEEISPYGMIKMVDEDIELN